MIWRTCLGFLSILAVTAQFSEATALGAKNNDTVSLVANVTCTAHAGVKAGDDWVLSDQVTVTAMQRSEYRIVEIRDDGRVVLELVSQSNSLSADGAGSVTSSYDPHRWTYRIPSRSPNPVASVSIDFKKGKSWLHLTNFVTSRLEQVGDGPVLAGQVAEMGLTDAISDGNLSSGWSKAGTKFEATFSPWPKGLFATGKAQHEFKFADKGSATVSVSYTVSGGGGGLVKLELSGCLDLGVGQNVTATAKAEPQGGSFRFWADPTSILQVQGQGPTANVTATAPGQGELIVEYVAPDGKTQQSSQPATCLQVQSINRGQPVPKIGLFDADGKQTSAIRSVPVVVQPDGAGDLLSYKPADPGILTAVGQGSSVALQGVRVGKTTFQASTKCGGPTGPVVSVEVVPCDDGVQKTLSDQQQTIDEELKRLAQYDEEIRSGEDFQTAEKIGERTLDLAIKTGSLIIGSLSGAKGASTAVKTTADLIGYASNVRDVMNGPLDSSISATLQTFVQAAGEAGHAAIAGAIDTWSAADQFGKSLGAMLSTSRRLEANRVQLEHWQRLKEDLVRRQKICRPGKDEPGPKDEPPPTKQPPPQKPPKPSKPTPPPKDGPPVPPGPPPVTTPPPTDQTPGDESEQPPVPPPPQPETPPLVGLPYNKGECGCSSTTKTGQSGGLARVGASGQAAGGAGQSVGVGEPRGTGGAGGITRGGAGAGEVTQGLKNLGQCVEEFTTGPLTQYRQTLDEWQAVFGDLESALANEAGREAAMKGLIPRFDALLAKTKDFDEKGRAFYEDFEACPTAVGAAADTLLAPLPKREQ